MKIKTILVTILILMTVTTGYAQNAGDVLFNQGIELQKAKNVSSQQKAIEAFQKAKVAFQSSDNKAKCDVEISKCNKTIDNIKQRTLEKNAKEKGDASFNLGLAGIQKKDYVKAQEDFQRAKEVYLTKEDQNKCDEQIGLCKDELQKLVNDVQERSVPVVEKKDSIRIFQDGRDISENAVIEFSNKKDQFVYLEIKASQVDWSYSENIPSWLMFMQDKSKIQIHVTEKNKDIRRTAAVIFKSGEATVQLTVIQDGEFFKETFKKKK